MHGIQSWVALPTEVEESEPTFQHVGGKSLPELEKPGARLRVIAGSAFGATSPVKPPPLSSTSKHGSAAGAALALPKEYAERAAYVVEGAVDFDGQRAGTADDGAWPCGVRATSARWGLTRHAPRRRDGRQALHLVELRLELRGAHRAREAGVEGRSFPKVPGDEAEFIPMPE